MASPLIAAMIGFCTLKHIVQQAPRLHRKRQRVLNAFGGAGSLGHSPNITASHKCLEFTGQYDYVDARILRKVIPDILQFSMQFHVDGVARVRSVNCHEGNFFVDANP
jgi:hypothetical protein